MCLELNGIKFLLQEALNSEFATIPSAHIQNVFAASNKLYAPTFLELRTQQQHVPLPYKPMAWSRSKGKGKRVQQHDDELDREMQWVKERLDEEELNLFLGGVGGEVWCSTNGFDEVMSECGVDIGELMSKGRDYV